jgi:1-acyl-sn-glycerol-3-phosphate acyltransferase
MPLDPLREDLKPVANLWANARAWTLTVIGMGALFVFNGAQVASLGLKPFWKSGFRRFNRWCADTWWGLCVTAADRLAGIRFVYSGESVPPRENAIVVANHQNMPDITTIMAFARSKHRLGDLKFFVKKKLKWFPGIGWGMQFLDCLFVDRTWTADREKITRTFHTLVDEQVPMWLVSFVEGTRATRSKIAASREYALAKGHELTEHVLLPRTKGFAATVEGLRDHAEVVYDVTIGYVEGVPTLWQYIKGSVRRIHVHVRRFDIEDLPDVEADVRQWLMDRFVEKDRLLDFFYRHGAFPDEPLPAALAVPDSAALAISQA